MMVHMDILSHGLWGGIAFGRENRKTFWVAFAFGILPDLLAFGPHFVGSLWDVLSGGTFMRPDPGNGHMYIPEYVFVTYNITHSIVVFLGAFLIVWAIRKRPYWVMGAWGLHVLVDIPTHNDRFFPTPFVWPVSDYTFNGISWGHPFIFFPNALFLLVLYLWYFKYYKPQKQKALAS